MARQGTSIAKITRPTLTRVFPRTRLFSLIEENHAPLVWITGPAGSGKTTLLSSYLEEKKVSCLWYQLDRGDADIATFFYYMGLAARKAASGRMKSLPLLTPEYLRAIPVFTLRYFESLYSGLGASTLIVFDNYHEVPEDSALHRVFREGFSNIPGGVRIVVMSRSRPHPVLARMLADNRMKIVGWEDLRLTPGESREILRLHGVDGHRGRRVGRIHEKTGGWAAGLILMTKTAATEEVPPELLDRFTPEEIFDYFAGEIFDGIDGAVQDFLLRTAFLTHITPSMAKELTGIRGAEGILANLSRNNYFIERRYHPELTYQYHPLFREFLLMRATEAYDASGVDRIRRESARLLEESGQIKDAAELYILAESWQDLLGLINRHADSLLLQGRTRTLRQWLGAVPPGVVEEAPWALYWMGACGMPFSFTESRLCFEKAFELFRLRKDAAGLFLSWAGVVGAVLHGLENFRQLDRWISVLDELVEDFPLFPSVEIAEQVTSRMFGALTVRMPRHPLFDLWKERAFTLLNSSADTSLRIVTGFYLFTYHNWVGDYAESAHILEILKAITLSGEASPLARITGRMAEAWQWLTGEYEVCLEAMDEALVTAADSGVYIWNYMLMIQGVAASLSSGNLARAKVLLDKMLAALDGVHLLDRFYYHYEASWYHALNMDLSRAMSHQRRALKLSTEVGLPFAVAQSHLAAAQLLHELGDHREASRHLRESLRAGRALQSRIFEFIYLLTEARFAFDKGLEGPALKNLARAMALGRKEGYVNFSWWRPSFMSGLCIKALEAGIETEYVRDLVVRRGLAPADPPLHLESWPWYLKIYSLGRFGLVRKESPVAFPGKVKKRPLEMLKAIIAFGCRDVSEGQLSDALWPHADGDVAHTSFATTLHRLRRLIGNDDVIILREGRVSLNERLCWVDAVAFERIADEAESAWKSASNDRDALRALRLSERAVELYRGHLLAGEEEKAWAVSAGERLLGKAIRCLIRTGAFWQRQGSLERAVECFQRGLEIDDRTEAFYQHLMHCHVKLGQRAEAVKVYRRCRKTLAALLGVSPSPETEAIYRTLISGGRPQG